MISTAGELIDGLGGTGAVAKLLEVEDSTVSTWRVRGLPAWACRPLEEAAKQTELSVDASLFERRPRARSAA